MFEWLRSEPTAEEAYPGLRDLWRQWVDSLDQEARRLDHLAHHTETEFLHLGDSLQAFSKTNQNNRKAASQFLSEKQTGEVVDLAALSQEFESSSRGLIETLNNPLARLESLLEKIGALQEFNYEMKDSSRALRMLGVSLKIETNRLDASEFLLVIEALDNLVEGINQNTRSIEQAARQARANLTLALKSLNRGKRGLQAEVTQRLDELKSQLQVIERGRGQDSFLCEQIEESAERISLHVGRVVEALQFHDASRQRIEHVYEAFEDVTERLHRADVSGVVGTELGEVHGRIRGLLKVQQAQLEGLLEEGEVIAQDLSMNFQQIFESAQHQKLHAEALYHAARFQREQLLQLGELFFRSHLQMAQISGQLSGLSESAEEVRSVLESLGELLAQIDQHRHALTLLAVNAELQAFYAGEEGVTLGVVSKQVADLSVQLQEMVEAKGSLIEEMSQMALRFSETFAVGLESRTQAAQGLKEFTENAVGQLEAEAEGALNVSRNNLDLEAALREVEDNLGFRHRYKAELEQAVELMRQLLEEMQAAEERLGIEVHEPEELSEELHRVYSMEQERLLHAKALGGKKINGATQTQTKGADPPSEPSDSDGGSDLGDNVELF